MRIALLGPYVTGDNIQGGVERHIKYLIDEIRDENLEIHIFSVSKYENNKIETIRKNTTLHTIKSIKLPVTITGATTDLYNLIKEVNKIKPDIIHGQMVGAPYGIATYFLAKRYPSILTIHTLISQNSAVNKTLKSRIHDVFWKYLEKIELKNIKCLIIVSEHLKSEISSISGSSIYSISNGIQPEWLKIESKFIEGRILFVGRILPIKGIENLIRSICMIKKEKKEINLHIVGPYLDLEYFEKLKKLVNELNIEDSVYFMGPLFGNGLFQEYSESQIFVLPSHDESNPFVLIEAMASGIPVVATDVGGIPYLIKEGENGFLVKDNDVENLSKKIIYLIDQKDAWNEISMRNRAKAKSYLWSNIADQTTRVYEKVIDKSKG